MVEYIEDRIAPSVSGVGAFDPAKAIWYLRDTPTPGNPEAGQFQYGPSGSIAVVGDWDGNGQDGIGVVDPRTMTWYLHQGVDPGDPDAGAFQYGGVGTVPVVGDWDGDGRDDIGVVDTATMTWYLHYGASPGLPDAGTFQYGPANARPVVGDWDGNGHDEIGAVDRSSLTWYLHSGANPGNPDAGVFQYGPPGAIPVVGDWNGNGQSDIGIVTPDSLTWYLHYGATSGSPDAGVFQYGGGGAQPVTGKFAPPTVPTGPTVSPLATVDLPALDLNLLGLEVKTSEITLTVSAQQDNGKLLGNLLSTAAHLIDLQNASDALNQVLGTTVGLLNSSELGLDVGSGSFDNRPAATTNLLNLHVAPVHLDLLGAVVDSTPIDVSITAHSGNNLILGNIVSDLANLFNDIPGQPLDIDTLNQKLSDLLGLVNNALSGIPAAAVPTVVPANGQILSLAVPALDLDLLGLQLQTNPINVNATALEGSGNLLGNVLTSLLGTLDATPDKVAQLNNTLNGVVAKVIGALNASHLTVAPALVSALPPALQTLLSPTLVAPAGSSAPVLDLMIDSQNGAPPVDVNLLGLVVTTNDIDAHLSAVTGDGNILGNLLYNVANLANPNGAGDLLLLLNALGSGDLNSTVGASGGSLSNTTPAAQELLTINLKPIDLNLLGLEVKTDPITATISAQGGDAKLLGNLLSAVTTLVNVNGVETALNNVLSTTVDLVNSATLNLPPGAVGSGSFDSATASDTPVLDAFVAPVHLDLLGLAIDTSPIHVTITAHAGNGLVLGNVLSELAHLFDNPPPQLTVDDVNTRIASLLTDLNNQIPNIAPAPTPPVNLAQDQFLQLSVAPINLNLLGLVLKTSTITVNAFDQTGDGKLLGNFLNSLLTTIDATPGNLTVLSSNLNALLAKVIGVLNATNLTVPAATVSALPSVLQTLISPTLITATPGATASVLDLLLASSTGTLPPVRADLLGLVATTSDIHAELLAQTGEGQVLGNLVYNTAHLLDAGNAPSLLFLLLELATIV